VRPQAPLKILIVEDNRDAAETLVIALGPMVPWLSKPTCVMLPGKSTPGGGWVASQIQPSGVFDQPPCVQLLDDRATQRQAGIVGSEQALRNAAQHSTAAGQKRCRIEFMTLFHLSKRRFHVRGRGCDHSS
jgi:hypothetical protein